MGESAGGGATLLHMAAAYQRGEPTLFQQAIAQSPAMVTDLQQGERIFNDFMGYLNVTNLEEARALDTEAIIAGNVAQAEAAPATAYIYGPVTDGVYVFEGLQSAMKKGNFDKSVKMLVSHNVLEGAFFFDPTVETDAEFGDWLDRSFSGLGEERKTYLMDTLYPPVYDGSLQYVDQSTRGMRLWAEASLHCTFHLAGKATSNDSYACK